jgi:predicted transcriptional regulator of viral defense system
MLMLLSNPEMIQSHKKYIRARAVLQKIGGIIRTSDAIRAGIHPRTLYAMLEAGVVERLSRGLYRLVDLPPLGNPDLVSVALRVPHGVICLVSALAYYELTTQVPHEIYLAVPRKAAAPTIDFPPARIFHFSGKSYSEGIQKEKVDDIYARIYKPAKTISDCFKYRNKIGLDVALEALKLYRESEHFSVDEVLHFARLCRVEKVMRPYLEALL